MVRSVRRRAVAATLLLGSASIASAEIDPLAVHGRWTLRGGLSVASTCIASEDAAEGGPSGAHLDVTGIPAGATVVAAYLYWTVVWPRSSTDPGTPLMDGQPLVPVLLREVDRTPCFPPETHTRGYRADVTSLVVGNGVHVLSGFLGGHARASMGFTEGATLFVVWCGGQGRPVDVVLYDGLDVVTGRFPVTDQTLSGFEIAPSGPWSATLALALGNGQPAEPDPLLFEGFDLDAHDPAVLSGAACGGGFYDHSVFDVTYLLHRGATTARVEIHHHADCYTMVAAALAVTADGAAGGGEPSALDLDPRVPPLIVRKGSPTTLVLSWQDVGEPAHVYRGVVPDFYSHGPTGGACGVLGTATVVPLETGEDHYFVVTSRLCGHESAAGRDSFGTERPGALEASGATCP